MNIYQLFPRLFGNKQTEMQLNGSKSENGCGTFADINETAIGAIKSLGITHIWLTGIIRHASESTGTHPDITKGRAGSPYAITDYHNVDPDLGSMDDFLALVERIHEQGLKVIIDFVPNHLARENVGFEPCNFYYCDGQAFVCPRFLNACHSEAGSFIDSFRLAQNDIKDPGEGNLCIQKPYEEFPAKATGNNVFAPNPSMNDWFDTVKLNYDCRDTWEKMLEIMRFWCAKGVDGFRVDMAEMVPLDFWRWMIPQVKADYQVILIAEIYQPALYRDFVEAGFDYLYDKVGLYNTLEDILCRGHEAQEITRVWQNLESLDAHMLRFMENHDEKRLASRFFVGDAWAALPAVAVAALMNTGPFMIYNGQESGEEAEGVSGFSGDDGRTTIFDYWNMPRHQQWMNGGAFDQPSELLNFYSKLLNFRLQHSAIGKGAFYDLMWCNPWYNNFDPRNVYAFLRYSDAERLLIVVNFNRNEDRDITVKVPEDALQLMGYQNHNDFGMGGLDGEHVQIHLAPSEVKIIDFDTKESVSL